MLKLLLPLVQVLFIGLKITGYIAWSWWLVLSPAIFWIVLVLMLVVSTLWVVRGGV